MKIATTKERILQFIDYKGISKQAFFKDTGLKRGFLDADKLHTSIPDTFIATIIAAYPEINPIWLLLGEGSMLKEETPNQVKSEHYPASPDSDLYYKMYKEEKAENRDLIEEIGALKQQIRTLKIENRALGQEVEDLRERLKEIKDNYLLCRKQESKKEMASVLSTGE